MEGNLIRLVTYSYPRAVILKTRLNSEGINCFLANVNIIRSTIPGGVKVIIKEKDVELAMRIVADLEVELGEDLLHKDDFVEDISRILLPIDFSVYSENAGEYAIGIAAKLNAELMLYHVYYYDVAPMVNFSEPYSYQLSLDETLTEIKEKAENQMKEFYEKIENRKKELNIEGVTIKYSVSNGIPDDEILDFSNEYNPGLIIMGTQGTTKRNKELFGSVTVSIIENAKVPVLSIPEISTYKGINKINILYATNFDKFDLKAIRKLMTLVYMFDVKIYCVHVGQGNWDKYLMESRRKHFEEHYAGYKMETAIIDNKDILQGLEDFIKDNYIDIVALTTHKRNFITRLFHPGVTKQMFFNTNTPLLVFHA